MSNRTGDDPLSDGGGLGDTGNRRLARGVAFWAAVALPFVHLPLLAAGLDTRPTTVLFGVLLAINVIALLLGHSYRRD